MTVTAGVALSGVPAVALSLVAGAVPSLGELGSVAAIVLQDQATGGLVTDIAALFERWFPTNRAKVLGTIGVGVAVSLLAGTIWQLGGRLKRYLPGDDVEAIQAVVFTVFAVTAASVLVFIWGVQGDVTSAFGTLTFDGADFVKALVAVLSLVVAYTLTLVVKGIIEEADGGSVMDAHQREALHHGVQIFVYVGAFMFILTLAGVQPRDLLVGAGAAGLVIGLAARQTLGAVFAGFVILLARPFEVGDWVVIDDRDGLVTDVSLFNTEIRTWDGEYVIVPNDQVSEDSVVNRSREGRLRISVDVGVDYDTDVRAAGELAREAMEGLEAVMEAPNPQVVLKQFGDNAVVLECRFWIENPTARKKWTAQTDVIGAIKDAFDDEGVTIPFPQRTIGERGEGLQLAQGEVVGPGADGASDGVAPADASSEEIEESGTAERSAASSDAERSVGSESPSSGGDQ